MRSSVAIMLTSALLAVGCGGNDASQAHDTSTTEAPTTTNGGNDTGLAQSRSTTAAPASTSKTGTAEYELSVTRELAYTSDEAWQLDVLAPPETGPWPVVVLIPGGYQVRDAYEPFANAIAKQGAVVYNVDVEAFPPGAETSEHVACAVRYAKATAADHGGEASRITVVGHSAGAVLGMVVALTGDDYARGCIVMDESATVDAFVGYEGPWYWVTEDHGGTDRQAYRHLRESDPDKWRALNPLEHVGGNTNLVVRLVHGDDTANQWYDVPHETSVRFNQTLLEAGYDTKLTIVPDADHSGQLASWSEAFDVMVYEALQAARS